MQRLAQRVMFGLLAAAVWAPRAAAQTDTIIQPGHLDFSRYEAPSVCVEASVSDAAVLGRTQFDPGPYQPERDSVLAHTVALARRCGAAFTPANVKERELLSLTRLGLVRGDANLGRAAGDRWLSLEHTAERRGRAFLALISTYMAVRPMQRREAEALMRRLDSLGRSVVLSRVNARNVLWSDADQAFDTAQITRQAIPRLAIDSQMAFLETYDADAGSGNVLFSALGAEIFRSPSAAVARTMQLAREAKYKIEDSEQATALLSAMVAPIGRPVPDLPVQFWYGPHDKGSWVIPGKVSLLVVAQTENFSYSPIYFTIRRLRERYGDALNITLVSRTQGYIRDSGPLEPAQEADSIRSYFQDYLKLPVTVGVQSTPFERLADGRRVDDNLPNDGQLSLYNYGSVVANRDGTVLMAGGPQETMLDAFLDRVIPHHSVQ